MFGLPEALMSFIRRQVGLRTDEASASGSLHAKISKINEIILNTACVPSYNIRASNDTEMNRQVDTTPVLVREIIVNRTGSIRVSFDLRVANTAYTAKARIYKNGVAVGTERTNNTTNYQSFSEDIQITAGEKVQLYIYGSESNTYPYIRNYRIGFDEIPLSPAVVTL